MRTVGIVPSVRLFTDEDLYNDRYTFVNNYSLRVAENGGIPVGILGKNGYAMEETLDLCGSFVISGGMRIWPLQFQVVEHCVRKRKPLLGICLGAQVISSYFAAAEEAERRGWEGTLLELYEQMKKERYLFVRPVKHHWDVHMVRGREKETMHPVKIVPGTLYASVMGTQTVCGATMHNYAVNDPPKALTVSGYAEDGVIEAVEYSDYILGVQYHPEVDATNDALFRFVCGTL